MEKARLDYRTRIESFMPLEPMIPSDKPIYLERELDEEDLKERYKQAYKSVQLEVN